MHSKSSQCSLTLIVTFPLETFLMLNPTVGIISSLNWPDCVQIKSTKYQAILQWRNRKGEHSKFLHELTAITFTNVVFPEYCKPTRVSSISSFQKRLLNQSKMPRKKANILQIDKFLDFHLRNLCSFVTWQA